MECDLVRPAEWESSLFQPDFISPAAVNAFAMTAPISMDRLPARCSSMLVKAGARFEIAVAHDRSNPVLSILVVFRAARQAKKFRNVIRGRDNGPFSSPRCGSGPSLSQVGLENFRRQRNGL